MIRIRFSRFLVLVGFYMLSITISSADDLALIIPVEQRCTIEAIASQPELALQDCLTFAQLGYADAQFVLGEYWYQGQYTPRDYQQALKWFEQASIQGHALAQLRLGSMFYRGEGVTANSIQAYIILKMSAINGSDEALDTADRVAAQMPLSDLEIANQVLAQIFHNYLLELSDESYIP